MNTLSTSLTDDVYTSEHVVKKEDGTMPSSLLPAQFNSMGSGMPTDADNTGDNVPLSSVGASTRLTGHRSFKSNKQIRDREKRFPCDVCHKKFALNGTLKRHLRTHGGQEPLCSSVGCEQFNSHRKKSRTRQKEKPFVCDVCNMQFCYPSSLKSHRQFHADEKSITVVVIYVISS